MIAKILVSDLKPGMLVRQFSNETFKELESTKYNGCGQGKYKDNVFYSIRFAGESTAYFSISAAEEMEVDLDGSSAALERMAGLAELSWTQQAAPHRHTFDCSKEVIASPETLKVTNGQLDNNSADDTTQAITRFVDLENQVAFYRNAQTNIETSHNAQSALIAQLRATIRADNSPCARVSERVSELQCDCCEVVRAVLEHLKENYK